MESPVPLRTWWHVPQTWWDVPEAHVAVFRLHGDVSQIKGLQRCISLRNYSITTRDFKKQTYFAFEDEFKVWSLFEFVKQVLSIFQTFIDLWFEAFWTLRRDVFHWPVDKLHFKKSICVCYIPWPSTWARAWRHQHACHTEWSCLRCHKRCRSACQFGKGIQHTSDCSLSRGPVSEKPLTTLCMCISECVQIVIQGGMFW